MTLAGHHLFGTAANDPEYVDQGGLYAALISTYTHVRTPEVTALAGAP